MKIGIDARSLTGNRSGVGYFLENLLQNGAFDGHEVVGFCLESTPADIEISPGTELQWCQITPPNCLRILGPAHPVWWVNITLHRASRKHDLDAFFGPNFVQPALLDIPSAVIVHDLAHRIVPETHTPQYRIYLRVFLTASLRAANHVVTVSENTKQDLCRYHSFSESDITVAYGAASSRYHPRILSKSEKRRLRRKYQLPEHYLIYVGNIEPRKNLTSIIKAIERFSEENRPQLVIVGQEHLSDEAFKKAYSTSPAKESVTFTGYVPESDLPKLYNLARAFVYPSKYEGFGLPVVEAMKSGIPVIASNAGSLDEVVGNGGITHDPGDIHMLTRHIEQVWNDEEYRKDLGRRAKSRGKSFRWDEAADRVSNIFDKIK